MWDELRAGLVRVHAQWQRQIRGVVREALDRDAHGWLSGVVGQGAGDLTYALDEVVERSLEADIDALGREVGASIAIVSEGIGECTVGAAAPKVRLRMLIDPIDGTRNIMFDMRSAWILTGVAEDRGDQTMLSDVEVAVQTEVAVSSAARYCVMSARRGGGAEIEQRAIDGEAVLRRDVLRTREPETIDNGFFVFFRFSPLERPWIAEVERDFLEALVAEHGLNRNCLYDDQYICNAGQLYLMSTGRYRLLADLRPVAARALGVELMTSKPYDHAGSLIAQEAGVEITDPLGGVFDAPFDTDTSVGFVAYPTRVFRERVEPLLLSVLRARASG